MYIRDKIVACVMNGNKKEVRSYRIFDGIGSLGGCFCAYEEVINVFRIG
jgi:hypothetical protein